MFCKNLFEFLRVLWLAGFLKVFIEQRQFVVTEADFRNLCSNFPGALGRDLYQFLIIGAGSAAAGKRQDLR